MMKAIGDSVLRTKMLAFLRSNEEKYNRSTKEYRELLEELEKGNAALNDGYVVLQLVVSQPLLVRYQQNERPSLTLFKEYKAKQDRLRQKMDSVTRSQ